MQAMSVFASTGTNPLSAKSVDKPEVNGFIDLDLTDIYKEYGYKSLFDMLDDKDCGRPKLQYRLGENVKVALSGWDFTAPNAFRPDLLVYIRNENQPNSAPSFQTFSPSNTLMPYAINQPLPPAGDLDWDWGGSQSGTATPAGPEWTTSELGYIRNFIEGGGGITTGMESCILDVFGAPMFNVKIRIYKDGTGTTLNGAAGLYMGSTGNSNLQGVIWLHPDAGLAPNVVTSKGNFSQEERMEVLTHEIIHACYDQLNFINIHPWTEGITECQSVLARKLWFDRNGYNDTFFRDNGSGKYFLADGVPPVLPTYELNNQPALAAYSRRFYTDNNILQPRMQSMAALRYQYAAAVWWKTWRDTTTGIISPANSTTFGANSFFVRFNSDYYDYAATNGGIYYIGVPGIRSDVPAINVLVSDTLNVMKGNTFVENQDYTSDWLVKQNVMSANDAWGLNLFVPNGPMTPAGGFGNPDYAGPANRINDLGPTYLGAHPLGLGTGTYWGVTVSPVLYEVFGGGGSSGERPVTGQASLAVTRLQNNTDVTAQVRYHDAYANFGAPPPGGWLPIPPAIFNFNGNPLGYITPLAAGGGIWPQLRFDMAGLPATGGYALTFNATAAGGLTGSTMTFYGDGEHAAGRHVGIINGGGNLPNSAISLLNTPPGGAFPARVPFGGDSSFNSSLIPAQPFVEGTVVGYEFREQGISYSDFEYANVGKYYYIHIITTSTNRMDETVGPWEGRIGHAVIAQATNFGGANPNRVYWNQFITEQSPGFINVARGVYRPDYIPQDSELVACYLYANSVGQNVGGNFVNQPIFVNSGLAGNPTSDPCFGELLGKCWRIGGDTPGCAAGGWDDQRSFFRFDITPFIDNIYDPIRITNLWQAFEPPPSLGVPYGYQIVAIYRNDSLPTNKIMIRDGALLLYQQFGQPYKRITFNNFRTPLDPANWPVDTSNAGAYVTFLGMSADNGGQACANNFPGSSRLEWDFWSISTNNEPRGDYFWPNPQPADPQVGQGGAWWALGNLNPVSVTLPNGVTNYAFSPRAWRQGTVNVGGTPAEYAWGAKQASSHWFWDQDFSIFAMKTALQWRAGTGSGYQNWWDWVNMDWAPNGNTGNLHRPSRTYLFGDDTTLTLVPATSCLNSNPGVGSDDGFIAPCIATPFPNNQCAGQNIGINNQTCRNTALPYHYPRHDERGHLNAVILQVPIVPSLTVEKLCDPNPVLPEGVITYTVIVRNDSPYPNVAPVVQEIYPAGVTFLDSTPAPDMGDNIWNKSIRKAVPLGTPPYSDDEGVLQPYEQFTITIRVRVGKLPKGTLLTNVVNAYSRTSPSVVSAICQVTVLGEPLITITKTTKKFMAQQGEKVDYTLTIQNVGTREATDITVVDMLPRELEYVSSLPSGSAGLQKITWAFGLLNPGQVIRISLTLRIRRDIRLNPGITINNIAVVTTKGGLRDEDAAMIMLRGGPSDVIVCECPDLSINFAGMKNIGGGVYEVAGSGKVKIGMHPYGGCGPYAMSVDFEDDGKVEYSFNIENDSDKEFEYNIPSGDYTMVVKSADRYGSTCIYTKKIRVK